MPAKDRSEKAKAKAKSARGVKSGGATASGGERVPVTFVAELRLRLSRPTAAEAAAFRGQCPDAQADALGGGTQAVNVQREVRALLQSAEPVLRAHADDVPYGLKRFGYFADLAHELDDAMAAETSGRDAKKGSQARLALAEAVARAQRTALVGALEKVATGDAAAVAQVREARGMAENVDGVAKSLADSIALARGWLAQVDSKWAVLLADRKVTAARLDAAAQAAAELKQAIEGKGDVRPRGDSPAVNRAEGRVLFEAERLYGAMEEARSNNRLVTLPVLGPTLRRVVLGKRRKRDAQDASTAGAGPAESTAGATQPAPTAK